MDMQFTWIGYYTELADKLLPYRNDRQALISKLRETYVQIDMKFPKLDSTDVPADIDPFTVFGLFNKGLSNANRMKIAAGFAHSFGIKADQPADFDGIPVVMALNATFYAFTGDKRRGEHDIDNLWRVFEAQLALADNDNEQTRAEFVSAYNEALLDQI